MGLSEPRIQNVLFNEGLELMNTVMEDDGELGIWLEVTHWIHLILFSKNKIFILQQRLYRSHNTFLPSSDVCTFDFT